MIVACSNNYLLLHSVAILVFRDRTASDDQVPQTTLEVSAQVSPRVRVALLSLVFNVVFNIYLLSMKYRIQLVEYELTLFFSYNLTD